MPAPELPAFWFAPPWLFNCPPPPPWLLVPAPEFPPVLSGIHFSSLRTVPAPHLATITHWPLDKAVPGPQAGEAVSLLPHASKDRPTRVKPRSARTVRKISFFDINCTVYERKLNSKWLSMPFSWFENCTLVAFGVGKDSSHKVSVSLSTSPFSAQPWSSLACGSATPLLPRRCPRCRG